MKKTAFLISTLLFIITIGESQETSIQVNGTTRNMLVYAPQGLSQNRPLLISLHGLNQDAEYQREQTQWEEIADTANFLLVYPRAISLSWDINGNSDTDFILTIIDEMHNKYGIDKDRVYLSGFSMGGMLTYHAATKIADKIAAFAPVSGYLMGGPNTNSSKPIPIIHTHGTSDDVVPYSGVQPCMEAWVNRNNCSAQGVVTSPYPSYNTNPNDTKTYWGLGDDNVEVVLLTLDGKGHWHSNESARIHTSAEIWRFVSRYALDSGEPKITITSPSKSDLFATPATITVEATASDSDGSISKVEFFNESSLLTTFTSEPYIFSWTVVDAETYSIRAVATDNAGKTKETSISVKVNTAKEPYTTHTVPGIIQLEEYDLGGNGFSYYDVDPGTNVAPAPDFRTDEDVDIENCSDEGGGYNLGWTNAGEWLEYTLNVEKTGKYKITLRAACNGDGRTVSLSTDGNPFAGKIAIPNTRGWQNWEDVVLDSIELQAGKQVLRLTIGDEDFINLNYIAFETVSTEEYSIQLTEGWNLIGYPFKNSQKLPAALSNIWDKVIIVKDMDSFYEKTQPDYFNKLEILEWGKGYFLYVSDECELVW